MKDLFSKNRIITVLSVLILFLIWEVIARLMATEAILPGPLTTFEALFKLVLESSFYHALGSTLLRGLIGFSLALTTSLLLGIPAGLNQGFAAFLSPWLVTIRSTPVISIILLALIWFNVDQVPVFIGFLTMFPILCTNLSEGIRSIDPGIVTMARLYQVRKSRILSEVILPGIVPFIYSGLLTGIGFGWRAIIIGEVLSQPRFGIGTGMQVAQSYLLVAELISWTLIAVIIGFAFEILLKKTIQPFIRWSER